MEDEKELVLVTWMRRLSGRGAIVSVRARGGEVMRLKRRVWTRRRVDEASVSSRREVVYKSMYEKERAVY